MSARRIVRGKDWHGQFARWLKQRERYALAEAAKCVTPEAKSLYLGYRNGFMDSLAMFTAPSSVEVRPARRGRKKS